MLEDNMVLDVAKFPTPPAGIRPQLGRVLGKGRLQGSGWYQERSFQMIAGIALS